MDKTEYRMKLDEINTLVEAQDYEGALAIADSIDWRRVKSVRTLCMVADIYEVNQELEKSLKMLQLAYKRSSVGKMILYRLVELSLKMGNYNEAVNYYNEYLETASNDTSKYILKYKIYKAQNAPLEEQISILEEYKDREYTERWVYELARLYKKAGKQNKCIETCDDLILWFGEGKYVTKAMELKMTYVPLTSEQKAKYDIREREPEEVKIKRPAIKTAETVAGISAAAMANLQKADPSVKTQDPVQEKPVGASAAVIAEAAAAAEPAAVEEIPETPQVDESQIRANSEQLQERLAKSFQEVLSGFNRTKAVNAFEALGRATGTKMPELESEEENIEGYQIADLEPETANEGKISAEKGEAIAHRTVSEKCDTPVEKKAEDAEVTSVQDMDLDALFAETSSLFVKEMGADPADAKEQTAEQETAAAEEIQASEEAAAAVEIPDAEQEDSEPSVEEMPEEAPNVAEVLKEALETRAVMEEPIAETAEAEPEFTEPVDETLKEEQEVLAEEVQSDDMDFSAAEAAMAAFEASLGGISDEGKSEEPEEQDVPVPEVSVGDTQEINLEEQLLAAIGESRAEKEDAADDPIEELDAILIEEGDLAEDAGEPVSAEAVPAEAVSAEPVSAESEEEENFIPEIDLDLVLELQQEKEEPEKPLAEEMTEDERENNSKIQSEMEKLLEEAEAKPKVTPVIPEKETPEEKRMRIMNATRPDRLTDDQKRLFSYFSKIPGMDDQILEAIKGVFDHVDDKTSRRGNVAVMGSHGTGKTRLSSGLVKAICKQLGLEAIKFANLDASDMNRKDPISVIGKMAGGFLLIERASYMTAETVEKLSQAMEFRTDSMILIIEDDKANMRKLLADYPEFAEKFETVISIPVFTNDELVTFARTYARENGYRMDEMGVLALYTLIGDNQREDEPITISKVKEMVDGAIRRAGGAKLGRKISKRRTDEEGRILLYEKDFDL